MIRRFTAGAALMALGLAAGCAQNDVSAYGSAVPAGAAAAGAANAGAADSGPTAADRPANRPIRNATGSSASERDQAWDRFEPSSSPGPMEGLGPDRTGGT